MLDFSDRTYANILAEMLDLIPAMYDKRDTSPIPTALGPAAYIIEGMYVILDQMQSQAYVGTATGSDLDLAAALGGLTRRAATPAVRLGEFNTAVTLGDRFSTMNGADSINFVVTEATDDTTKWWLTAETAGTIGNQYTGPILPITAISGLTTAELTDIIVDGSDEETDDELRARLTLALQEKPFAGNIASYRKMLLELEEVGGVPLKLSGVQVYPVWDGAGTVKCSVIGSDYLPISNELLGLLQTAVDPTVNSGEGIGMAPIGAQVTMATPSSVTVNIAATLSLSGTTIESVQTLINTAIGKYLTEIRTEWGTPDAGNNYSSTVFLARVIAAILTVSGVTNVSSVTINGSAADLVLTETASTQQVPVLGTVTLTEA